MKEANENGWPFTEVADGGMLDFDSIFGGQNKNENSVENVATEVHKTQEEISLKTEKKPASTAANEAVIQENVEKAEEINPLTTAFAETTAENAKMSLFEKPPVFCHKNAKEKIDDPTMTFEELRIRKSEDFADLEEGKYVSWSVEYCGIRKEIKDPKGTTIASVKETIERSREFLEALKKAKDKNPDCFVRPKVVMKSKGTVSEYKGSFRSIEAARESEKVICLIPSNDGKIYELRKTDQGEFIAPKSKIAEFDAVRAGFTPALPLVPGTLMGQIISFFRTFMKEEEFEALALIYWDRQDKCFFAYIPKQIVQKEHIEADLRECPFDDEERYIRYADIHSHNSMEAFFSGVDDHDELGTGVYLVIGLLDHFYPEIKARISCGGSFVEIDPATVIEPLNRPFPDEWLECVECRPANRKTERVRGMPTSFRRALNKFAEEWKE